MILNTKSPLETPRPRPVRADGVRLLAIVLLLAGGSASASYVTMVDNGPSSNRVNIAFLGDGYTAGQIDTVYVTHTSAMLNHLFNNGQDPFPRYEQFFNVYRAEVVSRESGADVPPSGIYYDTALDASYFWDGQTDRLLYVNQAKANAAMNDAFSGSGIVPHMKMITVNDTRYGGGGGTYAVFAGGNSSAPEIALHELGHSFGHLADEYGGYSTTYVGGEPVAPNVTASASGAKWAHWLGHSEPDIGTIGAFEGAQYYNRGLYRPSLNSKMRSLGRPFDAVSREQLILEIYSLVDPLDGWLDNANRWTDPAELWVETIDPSVISVEWLVDGEVMAGYQGERFIPALAGLPVGEYTVTARAYDATEWVRIGRELLEQSVSWDIRINQPPARIPGDADGNGIVDFPDFVIVQTNWMRTGCSFAEGDFDGDGTVTFPDFVIMSSNWGAQSTLPVPEPMTIGLLLAGLPLLRRRR